jgi:hypothetical protein
MTDSNTLVDNNNKYFGKLPSSNHKAESYSCSRKKEQGRKYLTGIQSCYDRICIECKNDRSFRGNLDHAITRIDILPEIFPAPLMMTKEVVVTLPANYRSL